MHESRITPMKQQWVFGVGRDGRGIVNTVRFYGVDVLPHGSDPLPDERRRLQLSALNDRYKVTELEFWLFPDDVVEVRL